MCKCTMSSQMEADSDHSYSFINDRQLFMPNQIYEFMLNGFNSLVSSDTRGSVACSLPTPCRPALTSHPNQGTLAQYHVLTRSSPSVKCQGQGQTFATVPEVQGHGASEHVLQQQEISPSQRSECPRCLSGESVSTVVFVSLKLLCRSQCQYTCTLFYQQWCNDCKTHHHDS